MRQGGFRVDLPRQGGVELAAKHVQALRGEHLHGLIGRTCIGQALAVGESARFGVSQGGQSEALQ